MKMTGITEQTLLTTYRSEPNVRRRLSKSTTLASPLVLYHFSNMPASGWPLIFHERHLLY
uniref:Uncharacterized protein n=1 Tax=Mesocestoides corti TaxID=53468 RepID=A0A5K3FXW5_MESCO